MKKIIIPFIFFIAALGTTVFAEHIQLDEPSLGNGSLIVSGNVPKGFEGQTISLQVIKPDSRFGDLQSIFNIRETVSDENGSFECRMGMPLASIDEWAVCKIYAGGKGLERTDISFSYINAADFGAISNITRDSSGAIQHAVDAAYSLGGGMVYLPDGSYLIQNVINLYPGVTLEGGDETILQIDNRQCGIHICNIENAGVKRLKIKGNSYGVHVESSKNIQIDGLTSEGSSYAVTVNSSKAVSLRNCSADEHLLLYSSDSNIVLEECKLSGTDAGFNVVEAYGGEISLIKNNISGCGIYVEECKAKTEYDVIEEGCAGFINCNICDVLENQIVSSNILFENCIDGKITSCTFEEGKLTLGRGNEKFTIQGNVFESSENNFEIMNVGDSRSVEIAENSFIYLPNEGDDESGAIELSIFDTKELNFSKNEIRNATMQINNLEDVRCNNNFLTRSDFICSECTKGQFYNNNFIASKLNMTSCSDYKISSCTFFEDAKLALCGGNENIRIENNILKGDTENTEVLGIGKQNITEHGIYITGNNIIFEAGADGDSSGNGTVQVNASNADNLTVSGNYIGNTVIKVNDCKAVTFSENMLALENVLPTDNEILLINNVSNGMISENQFVTSAVQNKGVEVTGIAVSGQSENTIIKGNEINAFDCSINVKEAKSAIGIHGNYINSIDCSNYVSVSLNDNLNIDGRYLASFDIGNATEGSRYYYNYPIGYVGKVFINGAWKRFGAISNDNPKKLLITYNNGVVSAKYSGYGLSSTDLLITAVYKQDGSVYKIVYGNSKNADEIINNVEIEDAENAYTVKSFLWNSTDGMKPIYNQKEFYIEANESTFLSSSLSDKEVSIKAIQ